MKIFFFILFLFISSGLLSQEIKSADTTIYTIKAKLLKAEPLPAQCGVMAWAMPQKFIIIESNYPPIKPNFIIVLIQPCPEFLGKGYFIKNRIYDIKVAQTSGAPFGYAIFSTFKIDRFLSFWIRDIKLGVYKNPKLE